MGSGVMDIQKEKESFRLLIKNMKEILLRVLKMATEFVKEKIPKEIIAMKVIGLVIRNMDRVFIGILMEMFMRVDGEMI